MGTKRHKIIYERDYDNPKDENGKAKPNTLLGKFRVLQQISEDSYSEEFIGLKGGKKYLVIGSEVSGYNGGMRYRVEELDL